MLADCKTVDLEMKKIGELLLIALPSARSCVKCFCCVAVRAIDNYSDKETAHKSK